MKQIKKYLFRVAAFLGLLIVPFAAHSQDVDLGGDIGKFLRSEERRVGKECAI